MFTTYIIRNSFTKRFYIGSTNNLTRRISEHNRGQTISTRRKGKWVLVYKEEFKTNIEAKKREKMIKSYKGGNAFKKLIAAVVQR
ncbi:GIY-YIG nuclease family protein [Candidatus Roizmanbacteria bacterium]|nr:GIY-YIG nuclease family protein [Candidatus Roizmanbacteria bacterium]